MENKVDFGEALRSMELGFAVIGTNGRKYIMEGDNVFYYPDPVGKPNHKLPRKNFRLDEILYKQYEVIY